MAEPLQTRLNHIRRRVRRALWLYGVSWVVIVAFGATLAVGVLDWLVHLDDPGVRLILGTGILAGTLWVVWRFLLSPLLVRFSDVEIALRIERRFPGFQDSLASTVQFLEQRTDPRLGSPDLQRRVIQSTLQRVDRVNVADVVETRDVQRMASVAVIVCVLAALIVGLNQAEAATALTRLAFPFSSVAWPKSTHLRLLDSRFEAIEYRPNQPLRLSRGDTLELFVENERGPLPADVAMQYRFSQEEPTSEKLRRTTLRDDRGRSREVGVASLTAVKGPLWFRAVGGDDVDREWYELHVVPPPLVDSLQVRLTPPAYSEKSPERLPNGVGHIEGLVGTRVEITAGVNKPLESAMLRVKDRQPRPISFSEDGRRFETSFVIEEAGVYSYWFDLRDREGFENSEAPRYEVRGIADLVPTVFVDEPATDLQVTADAEVPLRIVAKDDLKLKEIRLRYKLGDTEDSPAGSWVLMPEENRPEQQIARETWQLAKLSLSQGMRIVYHADATDYYDLGPEHVGKSIARTLIVVSPAQKAAELAAQQTDLLEELTRITRNQSRAREQVGELEVQLEKARRLRSEDIDMLKRVELDQRQISSRLSNPVDGVETRTRQLLSEMENNRIDDSQMRDRLEQVLRQLGVLRTEHLPLIEQELTHARKGAEAREGSSPKSAPKDSSAARQPSSTAPAPSAQSRSALSGPEPKPSASEPAPPSGPSPASQRSDEQDEEKRPAPPRVAGAKEQAASLARARESQSAVVESLEEILGMLSQWRDRRELTADLDDLVAAQEALNEESAETGRKTLTKSAADLSPQEQADLARLADRQRQQAQRLGQLQKKMNAVAEELAGKDRSASQALSEAASQLDRRATSGRMREAAEQLKNNSIGQAASTQQQVLEDLESLRDVLDQRSATDTETLIKRMKQAEQDLELLKKQQEELLNEVAEAAQDPNRTDREQELERLQKEQRQLREQLNEMTRRLERLQAQRSGAAARRAAAKMQQAESALAENAGDQAAADQQEALDDLAQAQRELAQARRHAEERLARELLERIADELEGMIGRQQNVIDETARLDALRKQRLNWSRAQLKSLLDLAHVQRGLKQETDRLVERLAAAEVFALALEGAARHMQTAADRLAERQTDETTLAAERAAKQRFVDLIAALKSEQSDAAPPEAPPQAGDGDAGGPQMDGIPQLAQLKMLKTLQDDLNRRTVELDELRRTSGQFTADQEAELRSLSDDQGRLADLARNLTQRITEAFETEKDINDGDTPQR